MIATPDKTKQIYLFFLTVMLLGSCKHHKKIDVSNIPVDIKIIRFDRDFDDLSSKPFATQVPYLENKYGPFYKDFIEQILQAGHIKDTAYYKTVRDVLNGQPYKDLKHDVYAVYPGELDEQNDELTDAFRRIKYYYPKQSIPKFYTYFSGFELQTSLGDGYVGIGLDLFLGADSRFYPSLTEAFPHYLSRFFKPDNITPRIVENFAREEMFPEKDDNKSLLAKMIYNGKIMYFMDQVLPDVADSTKIGYTAKQLEWAKGFEGNIWAYFLQENFLYETDYPKIQQFLTVAPFTPGLGEKNESAPKLGVWTGWQIVRKYMDEHPEFTLQQLMAEPDEQKILNGAKYHPK